MTTTVPASGDAANAGRPNLRRRALVATALVGTLLVGSACTSGGDDGGDSDAAPGSVASVSNDRQAVVTQVVETVLAPNLRSAAAAADAAVTATTGYCTAPTPEGQARAVVAVGAAIEAYERLDPVDMGPIMVNRTDGHVAYPVDERRVRDLLESGPPTDVLTVNERTASSTRGFTAAEHLLGLVPPPGSDPTRCAYLVAITTNASDEVHEVVVDSLEGSRGNVAYFNRLTGAAADAEPPQDVLNIVVNMAMTVLDSDAELLADRGEVSEASVRRATAAHLATLAEVWGSPSTGLGQLVDSELAERVATELQAALDAVDDGSVPASEVLAAVEEARATIGTEVVSALDIVVGFSENDGDS